MAVVLAIDVSGSMKGEPLNAVKQGVLGFLKRAREYDSLSIATFADDVRWEASWGASQSDVQQAIENLQARGSRTALYDAIQSGLEKFDDGKALPARRRLIVISDGLDEGSKTTLEKVVANASTSRMQIDSIGIAIRSRQHVGFLQRISDDSRGVFREAPTLAELKDQISRGIERLLRTPVALFDIDNLREDGKLHTLGVLWKKTDASDMLSVTLPTGPWWSLEGRLRPWQAGGAVGVAVLAVGLLPFMKTRSRPQSPPQPAPAASSGRKETHSARPGTIVESGSAPPRKATVLEGVAPASGPGASAAQPARAAESRKTQLAPIFVEPKPSRPAIVLRGLDGPARGRAFPMETTELWIGASDNNHIQIVNDSFMSANHCCIRSEQQVLRLYDNASTNKTYLNGEPLGDTARLVKAGDRIQTGESIFIVEAPGA